MTAPASRRARRRLQAGPSKGERRETAILDGMERLLAKRRFADITAEDIARAADLSGASSLYFYFASKDDVLLGLLERMHMLLMAPINADSEDPPIDEWVAAALRHALDVWRTHGATLQTFFEAAMSNTEFADRYRAAIEDSITAVEERIEHNRARGVLPAASISAKRLAAALVWMTQQTLYELFRCPHELQAEDELVETLIALWTAGLRASDERSTNGRTSIALPRPAAGIRAASSIGSSRLSTSKR